MPIDPIFSVELNFNIIGIITTGTLIGTFCLLSVLYFYFIDKDKLIQYLIVYFTFVLGNLITLSFKEFNGLGYTTPFSTPLLNSLKIMFDYCIVYCFYSFAQHILPEKNRFLSWLLVIMIPVFTRLGYFNYIEDQLYFSYITITLGVSLYYIFIELKKGHHKYTLPLFILYILIYSYYFVSHTELLGMINFETLDWFFALMVVFFATGYFLFRYKRLIMERDSMYEKLTHDHLTGLYSKNFLLETVRNSDSGTLLFIDINQFKQINDVYGHLVGDRLLKEFSALLLQNNFDTNILPSRYGGDEFVLYLSDITLENVQLYSNQLIGSFKDLLKELNIDYARYSIGLSIGLSKFTGKKGNDAIIAADFAMYEAKNIGNNILSMHLEEVT